MDREGAFKVCIFGDDGGVGKTTFVNSYLTKMFDIDTKMTLGADFYVKDLEINGKKVVIKIWDIRCYQNLGYRGKILLPNLVKGADGAFLLYDITNPNTLYNISEWTIRLRYKAENIPIMLVGTNLDLAETYRQVPREHGIEVAEKNGFDSFIEISSKTGQNVDKIFEVMTDMILKRMERGDYIRSRTEKHETFVPSYISDEEMAKILKVLDNIQTERGHYDILLIEDDLATNRHLTSYFESIGLTCKGVVNGRMGLKELAKNSPKVVILDIILPDCSGYGICKQIKSNQKFKNIPVFLFTDIKNETEKQMENTKADGYILKPFNYSDFDGILDLLNSS